MGVRRRLGVAAVWAALVLPAARSGAETVVEPIARLSLEGGYDSNVLYEGRGGDRTGRISPELGLKLHDPLWNFTMGYGGDYLVYHQRASGGIWNHRAGLLLDARPSRRLEVVGTLRGAYALDPLGLAQVGIFRTGEQSAWLVTGRGRAEWWAVRRLDLAATISERTVLFDDRTGAAMHAPGVEALWRIDHRLSVGGAYALGVFQSFDPAGNSLAFSNGLRARARYRLARHLEGDAYAGPAVFSSPDARGIVPEAGVELRLSERGFDLRTTVAHALGIGSTARPALVDSLEFGAVRRLGRTFDLRSDGGIWRSGEAPSGANATLGYAISGEAGMKVGWDVRVALGVTHYARIDDPSPALRRTTVGLRLGWALPVR
jgi:hypothetical protein